MERKTHDTAPPGQAVRTVAHRGGRSLVDGQLAKETCL